MISFQRRYQENTKLLTVCKWIADLLIVILLAYTLTLFLCDRTTISGNSMQPAIEWCKNFKDLCKACYRSAG